MDLDRALDRYAELLVVRGANVQPGQTLQLTCDAEVRDFAVRIVEAAYERGARIVQLDLVDERSSRARISRCREEFLDFIPRHVPVRFDELVEDQGATIRLVGSEDPDCLSGLDPMRSNRSRLAGHRAAKRFYEEGIGLSQVQWTVAAAATAGWGRKLFPGTEDEVARRSLWESLLKIARADREDCLEAWDQHNKILTERGQALDGLSLDQLRFQGPGTDLTVGLSTRSRFEGGSAKAARGVDFIPNIPTEEVFTTPDWRRTSGTARVTRPFLVNGTLVEELTARFEDGVLVEHQAKSGGDVFEAYIDSDEGARRLGEVALVGTDSPIFQSQLVFGEILLDENAACHIAVGNAYKSCLAGSEKLDESELEAVGFNKSSAHTDMMISDETVDVIGIDSQGREITILEKGAWVDL